MSARPIIAVQTSFKQYRLVESRVTEKHSFPLGGDANYYSCMIARRKGWPVVPGEGSGSHISAVPGSCRWAVGTWPRRRVCWWLSLGRWWCTGCDVHRHCGQSLWRERYMDCWGGYMHFDLSTGFTCSYSSCPFLSTFDLRHHTDRL